MNPSENSEYQDILNRNLDKFSQISNITNELDNVLEVAKIFESNDEKITYLTVELTQIGMKIRNTLNWVL